MKLNYQKCGEMYRTNAGLNCFVCDHCGIEFETSRQIMIHMDIHYPILMSCPPTPKPCFTGNVEIKEEPLDFSAPPLQPDQVLLPEVYIDDIKSEPEEDEELVENKIVVATPSEQIVCDANKRNSVDETNDDDFSSRDIDFSNNEDVNPNDDVANNDERVESTNDKYFESDPSKTRIDTVLHETGIKHEIEPNVEKKSKTGKVKKMKNSINEDGPTHFTCEYCGKLITMKFKEKHMWTHTNDYPFKCDSCNRGYMCQAMLDKHRQIHRANYTRPTCDYCSRQYPNKYKLTQHMLRQHLEGYVIPIQFRCEECDRGFHTRGTYDAHLRRHRNEKPYQCAICGLAFVSVPSLNSHRRRHLEKPFECNACGRKFLKEHQLYEHKLTHSGLKAFECQICQKTFASKKVLGNHKRLHDAEKRYKCKVCGQKFHQASGRRNLFQLSSMLLIF